MHHVRNDGKNVDAGLNFKRPGRRRRRLTADVRLRGSMKKKLSEWTVCWQGWKPHLDFFANWNCFADSEVAESGESQSEDQLPEHEPTEDQPGD